MAEDLTSIRSKGEAYVWLTSMGLTLGLCMIIGLLGLIAYEGLNVFWPKRIVEITLKEGSGGAIQGKLTISGQVTTEREKLSRDRDPKTGELLPAVHERQLFVGSKEVYGFAFRFIDDADILSTDVPEGIMRFERTELGDMIGYPIALVVSADERITADDPTFKSRLSVAVSEAVKRRKTIKQLEKVEIGKINHKVDVLKVEIRTLERAEAAGGTADDALKAQYQAKIDELNKEYDVFKEEVDALREEQAKLQFEYKLTTGQEKVMPVGKIISYYYPNQLGFTGRLSHFISRIWHFVSEDPREANTEGGIFPAIFGTLVMTVIMSLMVTPFGVIAAIYLREYAKQGPLVRMVRIAINNLAGVPSIVFGVFGLGFFVYLVGGSIDEWFFSDKLPASTFGTGGIMWAAFTLALLTVPVVIVASEEALASVPRGVREGSLACGASRWQTIQRVVLPASAPGIMTGVILAMARGAGEVAPLMLVGVIKHAPALPVNGTPPFIHLDQKFMHLGFHIYDLGFQSPDSEAAKPMVFATTLLLIALVVVLNLAAIIVRERLRRKYATGAF